MGRVAGSYGVRGWIRVDEAQAALPQCAAWWIGGTEYPVEQVKQHSGTLLAKLAGMESREAARKLKGSTVYVLREVMPAPEPGHYYLADLVGLEVVNEQGVVLGTVKRWMFNGAQDVMEVAGDGKVRLLPWIPEVVKKVDLLKKQIDVTWGADW
ncbi:MAG TPA: ribosome maturation factor RimM [Burkholderiales bacterium]|jgi:16S rRNA processing protein RimM|nr:ribosome maturation factor RimM [Burkholderiales bacterium]